jgi:BolA protein
MNDTISLIKTRLSALDPALIEVEDDSALHAGHAGAGGGGHYRLKIISSQFSGLGRVARHRLVYQTLGELMQNRIHALAIEALAPHES